MRKVLAYDIGENVPYVNWIYLYYERGINDKTLTEKEA